MGTLTKDSVLALGNRGEVNNAILNILSLDIADRCIAAKCTLSLREDG